MAYFASARGCYQRGCPVQFAAIDTSTPQSMKPGLLTTNSRLEINRTPGQGTQRNSLTQPPGMLQVIRHSLTDKQTNKHWTNNHCRTDKEINKQITNKQIISPPKARVMLRICHWLADTKKNTVSPITNPATINQSLTRRETKNKSV